MLTTTDINKLKVIFVTKQEFTDTTKDILELIGDIRTELKADIQTVKNDILTFKDEILHELVAMRQENMMFIGARDMLENHEKRISFLEENKLS